MMDVKRTSVFDIWLRKLKDRRAASIIDPKFRDAIAHRLHISGIPVYKPINSDFNPDLDIECIMFNPAKPLSFCCVVAINQANQEILLKLRL